MPHRTNHRGLAPEDDRLFGSSAMPLLCEATSDLCWLLDRGYALSSSLELVGNRYSLRDRQRLAIGRSSCTAASLGRRRERGLSSEAMSGRKLWVDGYNVLMSMEAALGGAVLLIGRDGCCRDVLGIHGSYHRVRETEPALRLIGGLAAKLGITACHWWLDKPVSNSGRLRSILLDVAAQEGWDWSVDLAMNPDRVLVESGEVVATADSAVLDRCERWFNLGREVIARSIPAARLVDLSTD